MICPICKIRPKEISQSGKTKGKKKSYCRPCQTEKAAKYYLENRAYIIDRVQKHQKRTNYASEKTPEARKRRYIKRKTRMYFPITNQKCELCPEPATEHHHNTDPIEYDKFQYCCHDCHMDIHVELNKQEETNGRTKT